MFQNGHKYLYKYKFRDYFSENNLILIFYFKENYINSML